MLHLKQRLTLLSSGVVALLGCGASPTSPSTADAGSRDASLPPGAICAYDFEMRVTAGPSAPFSVAGRLSLGSADDHTLTGSLQPTDVTDPTRFVHVTGQRASGSVSLRFVLPDGRVISGVGAVPAGATGCMDNTPGTLMGPAPGDTGDWSLGLTILRGVVAGVMYARCVANTYGSCIGEGGLVSECTEGAARYCAGLPSM